MHTHTQTYTHTHTHNTHTNYTHTLHTHTHTHTHTCMHAHTHTHTHTNTHTQAETDIDDFLSSTSDVFVVGQKTGHGHGEQLRQVTQAQTHVQSDDREHNHVELSTIIAYQSIL